jgi:hypothetical protein
MRAFAASNLADALQIVFFRVFMCVCVLAVSNLADAPQIVYKTIQMYTAPPPNPTELSI